jgi:serine/threonine protein phosphatase 1
MKSSQSQRVFAIGDIHGCAAELSALISKINPSPQDVVVFLGDYIDRGPNSKGVVDLVLDLGKRCQVVALKGNHEAMLLDFLDQPESAGAGLFIVNGGTSTLASYSTGEGDYVIPESHIDFFRNLKLTFETDTHFFVHAGVPDQPLASLIPSEQEMFLLWTRQPFLNSHYSWEKIVVHGHTPADNVEMRSNRINLDTGCVYGGRLTALELPAKKFHFVEKAPKTAEPVVTLAGAAERIGRRFSGSIPVKAWKLGERPRSYETLNYNQFGLLMRDLTHTGVSYFHVGEEVEGEIGASDPEGRLDLVKFKGVVVRSEARKTMTLYGVRIDRISGGVWGPNWIERPS